MSLAGCSALGADHATYWSESRQLTVDYDAVMTAARESGYTVDAPYYVGTRDARGIHPTGLPALDQQLGPAYRVFGVTFFHTEHVFLECWLAGDVPTVSLFDDRDVVDVFPVESLPPEPWLVDRLSLAFDVAESTAGEYAEDIRQQVADGTDTPRVEVDAPVEFGTLYETIATERTAVVGSETGGDGWYEETSVRDDQRVATVTFVVQSMEVRHRADERTYTLKLDRLGGFYLQILLPVGEEIPEDEYRGVFRRLFEDLGLPPAVVDDLQFEYAPSVW